MSFKHFTQFNNNENNEIMIAYPYQSVERELIALTEIYDEFMMIIDSGVMGQNFLGQPLHFPFEPIKKSSEVLVTYKPEITYTFHTCVKEVSPLQKEIARIVSNIELETIIKRFKRFVAEAYNKMYPYVLELFGEAVKKKYHLLDEDAFEQISFNQITVLDGFIAEGKSKYLANLKLEEFEGSEFFRMELPRNIYAYKTMPARYFKVFILFANIYSCWHYYKYNEGHFYLYRLFSHLFFDNLPCSKGCTSIEVCEAWHKICPPEKFRDYNIEWLYKLMLEFSIPKCPVEIILWYNPKLFSSSFNLHNWRSMEKTIYSNHGEVSLAFSAFNFYTKLFTKYFQVLITAFDHHISSFCFMSCDPIKNDHLVLVPLAYVCQPPILCLKHRYLPTRDVFERINDRPSLTFIDGMRKDFTVDATRIMRSVLYFPQFHYYLLPQDNASFRIREFVDYLIDHNPRQNKLILQYLPITFDNKYCFTTFFEPFIDCNYIQHLKLFEVEIPNFSNDVAFHYLRFKTACPNDEIVYLQPRGTIIFKMSFQHSRVCFYFLNHKYLLRGIRLYYDNNNNYFVIENMSNERVEFDLRESFIFFAPPLSQNTFKYSQILYEHFK